MDEPSISIRLRIELVGIGMELAGQRMKLRSGSLPDPRARLIPMLGRLQSVHHSLKARVVSMGLQLRSHRME